MKKVLLTVSGAIPEDIKTQIAEGKRPEADYIALSRTLDADLLDYSKARQMAGWFGKLLEKIGGPNLLLAWCCCWLRKNYQVVFTDGEQVGIPFALLLKFFGFGSRPRHLMIVHILSVPKKMIFFDRLGLAKYVDIFFVYSTWQKRFIETRWKVPPQRVVFTPFMVDTNFFDPVHALPDRLSMYLNGQLRQPVGNDKQPPLICAVGLEFRDYPTLVEAIRGLHVILVIAAASPWSKRKSTVSDRDIPENVIVQRFSQLELRDLYAASRLVVMPLYPVNFQAGVTAILEAMAMEKAVICSRTPGQTDVVLENQTGIYVPPTDPAAMRAAILDLLSNPEKAEALGRNGRQRVREQMSLDCYVKNLKAYMN